MMGEWTNFHFLRPLWGFIFLPLFAGLFWLRHQKINNHYWSNWLNPRFAKILLTQNTHTKNSHFKWIWAGTLGSLIILALMGPTWKKIPTAMAESSTRLVILLDLSFSMRSTDIKPSRIKQVQFKLRDILKNKPPGLVNLVLYAGTAHTVVPMTRDPNHIVNLIGDLYPEIMPLPGNNPLAGLQETINKLKNSGEGPINVLWITDEVELNQVSSITAFLKNQTLNIHYLIYGIGTAQGAPISLPDGLLMRDSFGQLVIPTFNEFSLKDISSALNANYVSFSFDETDLKSILNWMKSMPLSDNSIDEKTYQNFDEWQDMGPWLLWPVVFLAAFGARRGLVFSLLMSAMLFIYSVPVQAEILSFKNKNQQAYDAFTEKKYSEAMKQFSPLEWKAASAYRDEQYDEAIKMYQQSNSAESHYNLGNALVKKGDYLAAIRAYEKAIELNSELKDAQFNKTLVEEWLKKQQQNPQASPSPSDNQKDDSSKQGQSQNQAQQQQSQQGKPDSKDSQKGKESKSDSDSQPSNQSSSTKDGKGMEEDKTSVPPTEDSPTDEEQQVTSKALANALKDKPQEESTSSAALNNQNETQPLPQDVERWLQGIEQDPGGLLKRKLYLEARKYGTNGLGMQPNSQEKTW
ncbi:MAG: VWA domain-containing protein [Pseudomonadota bacterium]